jgi:hypothetical protein
MYSRLLPICLRQACSRVLTVRGRSRSRLSEDEQTLKLQSGHLQRRKRSCVAKTTLYNKHMLDTKSHISTSQPWWFVVRDAGFQSLAHGEWSRHWFGTSTWK